MARRGMETPDEGMGGRSLIIENKYAMVEVGHVHRDWRRMDGSRLEVREDQRDHRAR